VSDTLQLVVSNPAFSPPPGPTVSVSSSPSPQVGKSLAFTATIAGSPGLPAPTGSVGWSFVGSPGTPACQEPNPGAVTSATSTCTIATAQAGTYQVAATYSGDANYGSSSGFGSATVPRIAPSSATTTAPPTTVGQPLTFTTTITGFGGLTPTGTVNWSFSGSPGTPACTPNPSTQLSGTGSTATTTCNIGAAQAGTYYATANYSGDPNYLATSSTTTVTVTPLTVTGMTLANGTQKSNPTPVAGKIQQDDSIAITFSAELNVGTICSTWTGNTTNQTNNSVDVNVSPQSFPGNADVVTATGGTCNVNFGSINLGSSAMYVTGPVDFTGSTMTYSWNSTTATSTLTIVLGTPTNVSQRLTVPSSTAVYTPSASMMDPWGYSVSGTASTTGTQF
jgi:large repetitive protein